MALVRTEGFDKETRATIPTPAGGDDCIAISGYAQFYRTDPDSNGGPYSSDIKGFDGDNNDFDWLPHETVMTVGPQWRNIKEVSAIVVVGGFTFADSDTADASGCQVDSCTVGPPTGNPDQLRINLVVRLRVRGGYKFQVTKLAYHLVAVGEFPRDPNDPNR